MLESAWTVRNGRLYVEEVACSELVARFGSPLYVISEQRLRANVRRLGAALAAAWPHGPTQLLPSLKANPTLATRAVLTEEGVGCDTFGATELEAALRAGVPPEWISVNGASKSASLIGRAVDVGARITLDSAAELRLVEEAAVAASTVARVRLRLRPRLTGIDAKSDFGTDGESIREVFQAYKAGIPIDDVPAVGRTALVSPNVDLVGLHVHLTRQTGDVDLWRSQVESFVELLAELSAAWDGWLPREIDIGGGWPTPLDPVGRRESGARSRSLPEDGTAYATAVASTLAEALRRRGLARPGTLLEAEPGRAVYADAGVHLATVTNVKEQRDPDRRRWVETDTSEVFLPDTLFERALFPVVRAEAADAEGGEPVDVTGISCNFDVLAPGVALPDVTEGDVLAFLETGAYQEASSSNFNGLPRPATVLVNGTQVDIVKRREIVDDVLARDVVPARLLVREGPS